MFIVHYVSYLIGSCCYVNTYVLHMISRDIPVSQSYIHGVKEHDIIKCLSIPHAQCMNLLNIEVNRWLLYTQNMLCIESLILYLHGCCYQFTLHAKMEIYMHLNFGTCCCIHNQIYIIHLWTWNLSVAETVENCHLVTSSIVSVVASDLILMQPPPA